ncbi:MAG: DUF6732 family protein [Candidatus Puniceispirillaceae bacterium]
MKISGKYIFDISVASAAIVPSVLPVPAFAHWGHLGELAGHGHLIAVGLGALAVIGAAGLAVLGKEDGEDAEDAADAADASLHEGDKAHG